MTTRRESAGYTPRRSLESSITAQRSSKSLDSGLARTALAVRRMMNPNQSFNNSTIDDEIDSDCDHHHTTDDDLDFDGDSFSDYGADFENIESQHDRQNDKEQPRSAEGPMTHTHVEFDPLALGRGSHHAHSKQSSDRDGSNSNNNSVASDSDKTSCELSSTRKGKKPKKKNNSKVKNIVRSETRRIWRWKLASLIFVGIVGLVGCVTIFLQVYNKHYQQGLDTTPEKEDDPLYYRTVFAFQDAASRNYEESVRVLEEISTSLTSYASGWNTTANSNPQSAGFPFVTLPNFPDLAKNILEVGKSGGAENETEDEDYFSNHRLFQRVFWAPIVDTESTSAWESYAFSNQGWIMDTDVSEMPGDSHIPPTIHTDLLEETTSETGMIMTSSFQFSSAEDAKQTPSYLPAWQTLDFNYYGTDLACDVDFVNFDLYSWFSSASEARRSIPQEEDGSISFGSLSNRFAVHLWNDKPFVETLDSEDAEETETENGEKTPTTLFIRVPVHDTFENQDTIGYVFAALEDEIGLFREGAIESNTQFLPLRLVVKEERAGRKGPRKYRTYEIRGNEIIFKGNGDLHDEKYNDMAYEFKLLSQSELSTSSTEFTLYPTEQFFIHANTLIEKKPSSVMWTDKYPFINAIWAASLVAAVFAVILILFVCYDNSVEDRQRKLLRQAERTDAIVGSMFPANIQGRLMMIDDDTIESEKRGVSGQRQRNAQKEKEGSFPPILTGFDASGHTSSVTAGVEKASMTSTLNNSSFHNSTDGNSSSHRPAPLLSRMGRKYAPSMYDEKDGQDEALLRFGNTKPMADFYPNTTILMCDIAGFTAWSSARAPADVFRLLETIYGAFDDIARAEKVFKVETVGDCYVACAGLPVRQPKHAVIMAKYAKKTLKRYETLIKKLETYLGPDTVDLGLRMGMHSGPVTAGVLRGDKTRFQLFGDTVNTASRMESTGRVNMIQVSPQTANLLKDEGLGKWVMPRENMVTVKGKGEMQTYWLLRSSTSMSSTLTTVSTTSSVNTPLSSATLQGKIWKAGGQPRRNSMGASNASWETSSTGTQSSGSVHSHPQRRHSNQDNGARNSKERRLIEWMVETFMKSLKKIATHRKEHESCAHSHHAEETLEGKELALEVIDPEAQIIEEIKEVIPIRQTACPNNLNSLHNSHSHVGNSRVAIPRTVERQLRDFITVVSLLYHDHAFHNFEHCAHVLMSVLKLLSRILESKHSGNDDGHAFGITSDPLLEFACLFSALIHDVDHSGVPNAQLVHEKTTTAVRYNNRSVAEQHSIAVSWALLMQPCYRELRECIYRTQAEYDRFRQYVVNSVMATDIMDRELKKFRDNRWDKAFELKNDFDLGHSTENANRMGTVVLEHMIQASDVAHTMQHWHVYLKFNERFFKEQYQAYKDGRAAKDPSENWYEGELNFFKFYIIPLASKLKECEIFGVSGDEYFFHAESNRSEWALKGKEIVKGYLSRANQENSRDSSRSTSPSPMLTHQLLDLPEGSETSFRAIRSDNPIV